MVASTAFSQKETYFAQNKLWLLPAAVGFMFGASPLITEMTGASFLPTWACTAAAGSAAMVAGIGAMFTDTLSARFVSAVGGAVSSAVLFYFIWTALVPSV